MRSATLQDYKVRLLRVLVHIQRHLDDVLTLDGLAALAHFSPHHFHRVFTGMIGESVQTHVRRLRLERAAVQLKLGRRSVTEIALGAGYDTHEAFTRAFKGLFGVAPSRFRALKRPSAAPAHGTTAALHYDEQMRPRTFRSRPLAGKALHVGVRQLPARRVAFVRHMGPYSTCHQAWDKLCAFLGKEGWLGGDSLFIGICHDDPEVTLPKRIRYDACVSVDEAFAATGEVGVQTIAAGDYAVMTHFGPYARLGESYARLMGQWLPRSGRELAGVPCYEVYLNDPQTTDPEDLLTDIHVPLEPKGVVPLIAP